MHHALIKLEGEAVEAEMRGDGTRQDEADIEVAKDFRALFFFERVQKGRGERIPRS